jgi:hypothetical protein
MYNFVGTAVVHVLCNMNFEYPSPSQDEQSIDFGVLKTTDLQATRTQVYQASRSNLIFYHTLKDLVILCPVSLLFFIAFRYLKC